MCHVFKLRLRYLHDRLRAQAFLQRAFCCLEKKKEKMFAVWNYMSCRFLIVELVRGVKKFIFVCLVTSCYVLSMFQQLRWDFYNDRKYFAHKSVIK